MGKKVREYKSGDFIFAKVKGYPAWPARVQRLNGKKYFVYFYGTGETANLPPNMIFDYAENKDKFLTKTVKRRDFNDGVKQIEYDFANNVPLEQVIGVPVVDASDSTGNDTINDSTADDTMNETAANDTMDETADTTAADETVAEDTTASASTNNTEDSDDTGTLVIDEGKQKGKKGKVDAKAKETPAKPAKEPKTPRGKGKKEEQAKEDEEESKKEEEIVSRSGRKIRPKRYIDEQTEENATLPSPAPKKRRGASPTPATEKEKSVEPKEKVPEKNVKTFNAVPQSELEDLKEPFKPEDAEKDNLLITYLPSGQYVGIKLFQSRPNSFKNEAARLQWDKQAAANAVTLKMQLEKGQITSQSVLAQLVTDLNLTDEEKATLDKERETEEKKSRVQFLKTEMKLIELDAKIKTCLCLEKADTDLCVKLLDELAELNVKPLMLLKHPTCLETIKRMRAYIGNTSSWDLSENAAILFNKQAQKIRRQADSLYKSLKELFTTPEGLSFWEYFTERVLQFKKVTASLSADGLLEMIHEPIEMSVPTTHTMKSAIEAANEDETEKAADDSSQKKKITPVKAKKTANNTQKTPLKRQSSRKLQQEEKEPAKEETPKANQKENSEEAEPNIADTAPEIPTEDAKNNEETTQEPEKEAESTPEKKVESKEENNIANEKETEKTPQENDKEKDEKEVEPRAKRSRESKKTEPPPQRSPAKRKAKC